MSKTLGFFIVLILIGLLVVPLLCAFLPISWLNVVMHLLSDSFGIYDRNGAALIGATSATVSSAAMLFLCLIQRALRVA